MATFEYIVSGVVQGVGYRYYTVRIAGQLGLSGWVRNMPTGEVQVVASGAPEKLSEFERCLEEGPRMSRVTAVHRLPAPEQDFSGFSVRY